MQLDDGGETVIKGAIGFVGDLQLEVIEPAGGHDSIYRDALPDDGAFHTRWHHAGFLLNSADELNSVRACLTEAGHRVTLSGRNPGVARFAYFDARAILGHYLEYFYLEPADG